MFRVKENSKCKKRLLGYKWIEVIAIEPWALGNPDKEPGKWGKWAYKTINNMYICKTDAGLVRITSEDFWASIEEYKEYLVK